jgi:hypothetical protein
MGTTGAPCRAQTAGYPNLGFRSYSNVAQRSYNSGIAGRTTNNSFNTGFSGLSQASNNMQYSQPTRPYSTHYSAAAASSLVHQVTSIWGRTTAGMMMSQPQQQGMTPYQQSPVQPQQGMAQVQQAYAQPAPTMNGLLPPISRQQMLRVFLEGGTPQSAGGGFAPVPNGGSYAATRTAYCNYQTAENEARKARNAASRARYDKDRWNRNNDASQAEYAANNANYAAQRAESAAYTADSQAGEYANLARQAANRARQDANQARYNANTGP